MGTRSWTIGEQIALVLGVALVMLTFLGITSQRSASDLLRAGHAIVESNKRLYLVSDFVSNLRGAEAAERAYLLTGQEVWLEEHRSAVSAAELDYGELRTQTAGIQSQRDRVEKLGSLFKATVADQKEDIEARRKGGREGAEAVEISEKDVAEFNDINKVATEIAAEERAATNLAAEQAEAVSGRLYTNLSVGILATLVAVILAAYAVVRRLERQIGTAVQHVQSSSAELQASAEEQVVGAKEQVTASNEVSTTIKELLSTSRQIAESAQRVTHVAIETTSAARAGDQTVQRAQQAIDVVRQQVDLIVTHMLDLGRKSQEIGGILDIINELSEQTNILAINATIESAGAGEAGRRFAVVADEIRKLADRVGGSTKEIRTLIEEIRAASNTTVMATEDGSKAVDAGTRQFSEVAVGFSRIVELVGNTALASREIELSTKQQATAVEQVNSAIAEVARTARETEASLFQTLGTASELTTLSRDLAKLIKRSQASAT